MADIEVDLLPGLPRIGPLIARGALTSAGRPGAGAPLPGRRVLTTGVRVDPARLAGYSRLCGMTMRGDVPATYLHVLTFPLQVHLMAARDFPFVMAGMVHVANEMTLHRRVDVAEQLTLSTSAADVRPHRRGSTVDLLGRAEVGSETVWQARSTYLVKGAATDAGQPPSTDRAVDASPADPAALPWWARWDVPAGMGRRYAAVAGDVNPIHVSSLAAKAFGFPRAIAHGMWTHARVLGALEGRLPPRHTVSVEFRRPVLLPSRVDLCVGPIADGLAFAVTGGDGAVEHVLGRVADPGPAR